MTRTSLFLDKFYLFIQIIIFKVSVLSIEFTLILFYRVKCEYTDQAQRERVISDLEKSPLVIDFWVPYILPMSMACICYTVYKLYNPCLKKLFIYIAKGSETEVISKFIDVVVFIILICFTYRINVDVSKVFDGTDFTQPIRDSFTGIFATSLFILEGLNMYKLDYLGKLLNWITTDNQGNKYPPLFDLKNKRFAKFTDNQADFSQKIS